MLSEQKMLLEIKITIAPQKYFQIELKNNVEKISQKVETIDKYMENRRGKCYNIRKSTLKSKK